MIGGRPYSWWLALTLAAFLVSLTIHLLILWRLAP
jgi:hypothetical protein